MHELGVTQSLVDRVAECTVGRKVLVVNVRVGDASGVVADSMAFCFEVVTADTRLADAELVIEEVAGEDLSLVSVELAREDACA